MANDRLPLMNSADLGRLLGLSARQTRRLAQDGVLPRTGDRFDPYQCIPAYVAHIQRRARDSATLTEARLKLTEAQRKDLELRTSEREKRLVPVEDVGNLFTATMTLVGAQLDGIAGRMCGELAGLSDPAVIRARLFDECRRVRNAAADQLEALAADAERRESAARTATADA
jgi:hypothetical protein